MNWTFEIEMRSDWHIGSGFGVSGGVDRLVAVDEDGLPFIPGKTATSMLRDGAEQLAAGMDDGDANGPWHDWLRFLFGTQPTRKEGALGAAPLPAALHIRRGQLLPEIRNRLRSKQPAATQLRQSLFFNKAAVAIDPKSGTAKPKCLRLEQMARAQLVLTCDVTIQCAGADVPVDFISQFLAAASLLVTRIGAKRRRGAGKCRWQLLPQVDVSATINAFSAAGFQPPALPQSNQANPALAAASASAVADWFDIPLSVTLIDPACVADSVVGNTARTLEFIPGTHLLPFLTQQLRSLGIAMASEIQQEAIRVLPATIELQAQRSQPTPLAWELSKDAEKWTSQSLVNRMQMNSPVLSKQIRTDYCVTSTLDPGEVTSHGRPALSFHTHNTISEQSQRPTSDLGGVYSYQAIAPCRMQSVLRVSANLFHRIQHHAGWRETLGGRARIGRSSKDGYGRADIAVVGEPIKRTGTSDVALSNPAVFTLQLLSDTLILNARNQFATTATELAGAIGDALGANVRVSHRRDQPDVATAFVRTHRIESWSSRWQLPRPSLVALRAGSCVRLEVVDPPNDLLSKLMSLQWTGIGQRRAEGYGQLQIDHPLCTVTKPRAAIVLPPQVVDVVGFIPKNANAATLAQALAIEQTCWRQNIELSALAQAEQTARRLGWNRGKPASTQAGALRARVCDLTDWASRNSLADWLNQLNDNPLRSKKWPEGSVNKLIKFLDLESVEESPAGSQIWSRLQAQTWPRLTENGLQAFCQNSSNWAYAARALLDAAIRWQQRNERKPQLREAQHG